jgi:hypothetical protein
MWQRRTFHECAEELSQISRTFVEAYCNHSCDPDERQRTLADTSTRGVEVLRVLSLSVRAEQDASLTDRNTDAVGALNPKASAVDMGAFIARYRPPHDRLAGFEPLTLREALNKIAHLNPARSGFFASNEAHDLILTGPVQNKDTWIAVISLPDLCRVVKTLRDEKTIEAASS